MRRRKPKQVAAFRAGYSCSVDPDAAHRELETIRSANDGLLRPADVVESSREPDATLHPVFEWDDYEAAEKWREDQARCLIRNVCVVVEGADAEQTRPVYIHVRAAEGRDEQGYQTVAAVMSDDDKRASAIRDALAQLRGWQTRYGWLKELAKVSAAIDEAAAESEPEPALSL